jgi:hypothetical protein
MVTNNKIFGLKISENLLLEIFLLVYLAGAALKAAIVSNQKLKA